jgi:hypothetical protein
MMRKKKSSCYFGKLGICRNLGAVIVSWVEARNETGINFNSEQRLKVSSFIQFRGSNG